MKSIFPTVLVWLIVFQDNTYDIRPFNPNPIELEHILFMMKTCDHIHATLNMMNHCEYSPNHVQMSHLENQYQFIHDFSQGKSSASVTLIYDKHIDKYLILKKFAAINDKYMPLNETELFRELLISLHLNELKHKTYSTLLLQPQIYDFGVIINDATGEYNPYYIMQYIEGMSLKKYIIQQTINHNNPSLIEIKSILFQILYFLYIANVNLGFVHQDLHYFNIQITETKLKNVPVVLESNNTSISYYLNGPKIMIFDFGYASINELFLAQPGTIDWRSSEKGKAKFRKSICVKDYGDNINETHFLWTEPNKQEPEIIKKHTCLLQDFCVQFSGLMASFLCDRNILKNIIDTNVQKYILDANINYDLKHWLIYFSLLNLNSNVEFIKCNTFKSCLDNPYFDQLKRT